VAIHLFPDPPVVTRPSTRRSSPLPQAPQQRRHAVTKHDTVRRRIAATCLFSGFAVAVLAIVLSVQTLSWV